MCPVLSFIQSIVFDRIHTVFGLYQAKDYQRPNGIIIFDGYFYDKNGQRDKIDSRKSFLRIVLGKMCAYAIFIGIPCFVLLPCNPSSQNLLNLDSQNNSIIASSNQVIVGGMVIWALLFVLSMLEQLSYMERIVNFTRIWNQKAIMLSCCAFLMIVPGLNSNISKKNLICLMQPNITSGYCNGFPDMLCTEYVRKTDRLGQLSSLNITTKIGNGVTTRNFATGNCSFVTFSVSPK